MTTLHDKMYEAVADATTDLSELTTIARRRGLAIRRRRAALSSVGAVAAVTAIGLGWYAMSPTHSPSVTVEPGNAVSSAPAFPVSSTAPTTEAMTGRSLVAALSSVVTGVVPGTTSDFTGEGSYGEFYAELFIQTAAGAGTVGVNVQHLSEFSETDLPRDCSQTFLSGCKVTTQPNGDILRTYVDNSDHPGVKQNVAEVLSSARNLRLIITATNTDAAHSAVSSVPVLTLGQASAVALNPVWDFELPSTFTQAGAALPSYRTLDAASDSHTSSAK